MSREHLALIGAVMLAAICRSSASAQDDPGHWGRLYPSLFLTSDYRYEGQSLTGHEPTVQASIYWWRPDRLYAGL
jgi:hypothetical protein